MARVRNQKTPPAPRVRRTAAAARELILDAAEARLRDGGPEAVRLQDIAADVGISHPTILHHFASRDGLTHELGIRITKRLVEELFEALTRRPPTEASAVEIVEHVFATLSDSGTARLIAWRALSHETSQDARDMVEDVTSFLHEKRLEHARESGLHPPTRDDSRFLVRVAWAAALGDALSGDVWSGEPRSRRETDLRFRRWFAHLLMQHIEKA